jgi:hypothetical protein
MRPSLRRISAVSTSCRLVAAITRRHHHQRESFKPHSLLSLRHPSPTRPAPCISPAPDTQRIPLARFLRSSHRPPGTTAQSSLVLDSVIFSLFFFFLVAVVQPTSCLSRSVVSCGYKPPYLPSFISVSAPATIPSLDPSTSRPVLWFNLT